MERTLTLYTSNAALEADLRLADDPVGLVVFAHGSGSSRKSTRNRSVAGALADRGMATVLLDLLTLAEAEVDAVDARFRFDIPLLA